MGKKFYRLNQYITANELRVISEQGKQIGVMSKTQALSEAQKRKLDLVEIAPGAKPPVCKIIDFKKFRFLEAKKHQAGQKSKKTDLKEVRFSPFIDENDQNFLIKRARVFLKAGHLVKLTVRFRGRQMTKKNFGYKLLQTVTKKLNDFGEVEKEPKFQGRQLQMVLKPKKKPKNDQKQEKKTKNQKKHQKKV